MSKKIILFIVEGITDKTCLGYVLSQLISDQSVHFALTNGDITTKIGNKSANIATKICDIVKRFSGHTFEARDFLIPECKKLFETMPGFAILYLPFVTSIRGF